MSRGLLLDDALDVYDVFETVDGGDLSLATLAGATGNENFIVLSDWDGANLGFVRGKQICATRYHSRCTFRGAPCSMERS